MQAKNFFTEAASTIVNNEPHLLAKYLTAGAYMQLDKDGRSLLYVAVALRRWTCVDIIIDRHELLTEKDKAFGIFGAVENYELLIAERLLKTNPTESFRCPSAKSNPLHAAVLRKNIAAIRLLLTYDFYDLYTTEVNAQNLTPIELAVDLNHWDCVIEIAKGKRTDREDKAKYANVLRKAVYLVDNGEVVKALLDAGAGMASNRTEDALHIAVTRHDPKLVALLLDNGCCITHRDGKGFTPIQLAANLRHWDCVKEIAMRRQTDRDDKAGYGHALYYSANQNDRSIMLTLLNAGAAMSEPTKGGPNGSNVLHHAVAYYDVQQVSLLLSHNFPCDKLDNKGRLASEINPEVFKKGLVSYQKKEYLQNSNVLTVFSQGVRQDKLKSQALIPPIVNKILSFLSREFNPETETLTIQQARLTNLFMRSFLKGLNYELAYASAPHTPAINHLIGEMQTIQENKRITDQKTAESQLKTVETEISLYLKKEASPLISGLLKKHKLEPKSTFPNSKDPFVILTEIHQDMISKTQNNDWKFSGFMTRSTYGFGGQSYSVPKPIKKMLDVIDRRDISDQEKLDLIQSMAQDKQHSNGVSIFGKKLFMPPTEITQFYKDIFQKIKQSKENPLHTKMVEQLHTKILVKNAQNNWKFGGLIGKSFYLFGDHPIPKGIKQILTVIDNNELTGLQKLQKIHDLTKDKQGWRGASVLSLGLSARSDDTKAFYREINNLIADVALNPSYCYMQATLASAEANPYEEHKDEDSNESNSLLLDDDKEEQIMPDLIVMADLDPFSSPGNLDFADYEKVEQSTVISDDAERITFPDPEEFYKALRSVTPPATDPEPIIFPNPAQFFTMSSEKQSNPSALTIEVEDNAENAKDIDPLELICEQNIPII